ncbi:helix-turn-helix domain-containing protein, partial [Streptococcus gallolyticus]
MKSFSSAILAKLILDYRKDNKVSQEALATESGINRSILSKIEQAEHVPSIAQLEALANIIGFDITELFTVKKEKAQKLDYVYNIAVAGTGYVGLSIATLLAQHNHVTAVDIIPEKVELINNKKSPIQDDYIEKYLAEKDLD